MSMTAPGENRVDPTQLSFEVFDRVAPGHIEAAQALERHYYEEDPRPRMLPLNLTEIDGHRLGLLAFLGAEREIAGYNGVTTEYPGEIIEVGSLYVVKHLRGHGLAKAIKGEMFRRIQERYPEHSLITMCNEASTRVNEEYGFRLATRAEIPEEVFDFCRNKCPIGMLGMELLHQQGRICCDNAMVHEPLGTPAVHIATVE